MDVHRFEHIVQTRHQLYTPSIQHCLDIVFVLTYLGVPQPTLALFQRHVTRVSGVEQPQPEGSENLLERSIRDLRSVNLPDTQLSRIQLPMLGYMLNMKHFNCAGRVHKHPSV